MNNPEISVIIPLYNKEHSISATVYSVLAQTYTNFELIIIDDGSTDKSLDIVSGINDSRIRIISQTNKGVSATRNRGTKEACGKWIMFLDADDLLLPYALKLLTNLIRKNNTKIAVANFYSYTQKGELNRYIINSRKGLSNNNYRDFFFERFFIRMGNSMIKKEVVLQCPFDEKIRRYEDFDAFFKMMKESKVAVSPIPIMLYNYLYSSLAHSTDDLNRDYIGRLNFEGSPFWLKMILALLYKQGLCYYDNTILKKLYGKYDFYRYAASIFSIPLRIRRKVFRLRIKKDNLF